MKKRILCLCSLAVICLLGCNTNAETKTEINDYEKHDFVEYRDSNDYNYHITEDNETNDDYDYDYDYSNDYDLSSSYSIDMYGKGYEDVMEDDDYNDDLYYSDEDYEMGVDDAMDDYYDEYGEEW